MFQGSLRVPHSEFELNRLMLTQIRIIKTLKESIFFNCWHRNKRFSICKKLAFVKVQFCATHEKLERILIGNVKVLRNYSFVRKQKNVLKIEKHLWKVNGSLKIGVESIKFEMYMSSKFA